MKPKNWFVCGAILAAFGVVNGAYGAHGLRDSLPKIYLEIEHEKMPEGGILELLEKRYADYDTGVRYQMYQSIGLMLLGIVAARSKSRLWDIVGFCFFFGTIFFSGCLYALVFTDRTKLGMVVPIGGLLMIVGWIVLAVAVYRQPTAIEPVAA